MLYTKKGDTGTSTLFGVCDRFLKSDDVFEALGTLDELNSLLGVCRSRVHSIPSVLGNVKVSNMIFVVQENLFTLQAKLAGAPKSLSPDAVAVLEDYIAAIEGRIKNPHGFIITGETELSALFDYARAVSRRAERSVVRIIDKMPIDGDTTAYLNRISSLLYALARYAARNTKEKKPRYTTRSEPAV